MMADARDVWCRKRIDGYFADGHGLDAATIDWLRAAYIEEV